MTIELDGSKLIIDIKSINATSFRASLNSTIKWISLSVDIADLDKN